MTNTIQSLAHAISGSINQFTRQTKEFIDDHKTATITTLALAVFSGAAYLWFSHSLPPVMNLSSASAQPVVSEALSVPVENVADSPISNSQIDVISNLMNLSSTSAQPVASGALSVAVGVVGTGVFTGLGTILWCIKERLHP